MKPPGLTLKQGRKAAVLITFVAGLLLTCEADQVQMRNGDRYLGRVVTLNTNSLMLQSDVLGLISLPRKDVRVITLGEPEAGVSKPTSVGVLEKPEPAVTSPQGVVPGVQPEQGSSSNLHKELLSQATPEASKKYYEMLSGYLSGKLTVNDIRKEAKSVADQVRALKGDLGEDGGALDSYLAIIDRFLKESEPVSTNKTK